MTIMTFASLITGQFAEWFKEKFGKITMLLIWIFSVIGLICLLVKGNLLFSVVGLICFGTALALAASTLNAEAGMSCEKEEALSVGTVMMFMRSFGQFISPVLFTGVSSVLAVRNHKLPYMGSAVLCAVMLVVYMIYLGRGKVKRKQEKPVWKHMKKRKYVR